VPVKTAKLKGENPYPYIIPPVVCPQPEVLQSLDPFAAIQFIWVEVLLRSKSVMQKFSVMMKSKENRSDSYDLLFPEHPFYLDILHGGHHFYLRQTLREAKGEREKAGITIIDKDSLPSFRGLRIRIATEGNPKSTVEIKDPDLISQIASDNPRYLFLRLSVSTPPTVTLQALDLLLTKRHRMLKKQFGKNVLSRFTRKPPLQIPTFLQYLRCYDMKQAGYTNREIGADVYPPGGEKGRKRVVHAVTCVKTLIKKAEHGLPPFDAFGPPINPASAPEFYR
jgi:hypothetical protein